MTNNVPPIPANEKQRILDLKRYQVLDTLSEEEYDNITKLASIICDTPIALISLIDEKRQWFKSKVGIDVNETPREISFCQHAIMGPDIFEVENASKNKLFQDNPLVTGFPNILFYAGIPLVTPNGTNVGTLCVIDQKAKKLTKKQKEGLGVLAKNVSELFELRIENEQLSAQIVSKEKLQKEKDKLDFFFNLSLDFLCIANKDGYFEKVSPSFSKGLGYENGELESNPFYSFIHPDDIEKTKIEVEKIASGATSISFLNRYRTSNNEYKLFSWNVAPDLSTGMLYAIARDITDDQKNLERLKFKNLKIQELIQVQNLIFDSLGHLGIFTDENGIIQRLNKTAESVLGYSKDEVISKETPALFHDISEVIKRTEVLSQELGKKMEPGFETFVIKAREQNISDENEWTYISKSGKRIPVWLSVTCIKSTEGEVIGYFGIAEDITNKKVATDKIKKDVQTFFKIFDSNPVAMVLTNIESGVHEYVNESFAKLLNYNKSEVIGKTSLELGIISPEEREKIYAEIDIKGKLDNHESIVIKKNGQKVWVLTTINKVQLENISYLITSLHDIDAIKANEKELNKAKQIAEESLIAKDRFLANMSHEIRTPLNAIIGFTDLIAASKLDDSQAEFIYQVKTAGDNLLNIINDILDLSKIESGKLELESSPFNINSALKHVYKLLKVKAVEKKIDFKLFLDADISDFVIGDKGRLNQILMNLAGNALKFTKKGEVIISVDKIKEEESSVSLKFSIKDTGIGIPDDKIAVIFDRFTQAEESTTRKFGGTGLGLNISKQLIELQGGELNVKSELNVGSEFFFTLQYLKIDKQTIKPIDKALNRERPIRHLKILLCEDNIINQKLAKNVILNFGFELDIANNGQEGIELLSKTNYDLILMDLQMPVMDGYQTTIYIRKELKNKIPIIAMTAHSLVGEQKKCFEVGMNAFVPKPFKQEDLLNKIHFVIDSKETNEKIKRNTLETETASLKEINLSYLQELSLGNKAFEIEMIELFIDRVPKDMAILENSLDKKDFETSKNIAHKLKSSMSLFCLEKLVSSLSKIEEISIHQMQDENIKLVFESLKKQVEKTIYSLEQILKVKY